MKNEIWKAVPGYEGYYEVSDFGRIRNLGRRKIPRLVKPYVNPNDGYVRVALQRKGTYRTCLLHRLVLLAFKGEGEFGDHINRIKTDNSLKNLRWVSHRENCHHYRASQKDQTTSKFIGVHWDKDRKAWLAQIRVGGKSNYIGRFKSERDAHFAYQQKLKTIAV